MPKPNYEDEEPENEAFLPDGRKLPISSDEVKATGLDVIIKGELVLVISEFENMMAVNILQRPTPELISALENAIRVCKQHV